MNRKTILHHLPELRKQAHPYKQKTFHFLTEEEYQAYELLAAQSGRIEQEQLNQGYVQGHLYSMLK